MGYTVPNQLNLSVLPPQALVRYEKQLGTTSIGSIWLGRLLNGNDAGRVVVLRRIAKQWLSNKDAEWVMYGADAYAKVRHSSLLKLLGVLHQDADLVTISEHLESVRLVDLQRAVFDEGVPIPATVAVRIVLDAARATWKAHRLAAEVGIFPTERLFLPEGVHIASYGATLIGEVGVLSTLARCVVPRTVPELLAQLAPEELGARSAEVGSPEVFSLGVVLWELLANRWLFSRQSDSRTHQELLLAPIAGLDQIERFGMPVPDLLVSLVRRATARNPAERFASVNDLILAFERLPAHFVATEQQVAEVLRLRAGAGLTESRVDESERARSGTFAEIRASQPSISSNASSHDWDRPTFAQSSLVSRPPLFNGSVLPTAPATLRPEPQEHAVHTTSVPRLRRAGLLSIGLTMLAVGAFIVTVRGIAPRHAQTRSLGPPPAARLVAAAALPTPDAKTPPPAPSAPPELAAELGSDANAAASESLAPANLTKRGAKLKRAVLPHKGKGASSGTRPAPNSRLTGTSIDPQWGI